MTRNLLVPILAALAAAVAAGVAAAPVKTALEPLTHLDATLTIRAPDGSVHVYTPAMLEELPTYSLTTATPWREKPARFEGILLSDLLERHGMADLDAIRVIAENDYTTTIERAVWTATPMVIATRVDGRAHSRRERGPIQFVVDSADYERLGEVREHHLVWMAATIATSE